MTSLWAVLAVLAVGGWNPSNEKCVFGTVERVAPRQIRLRTVSGPVVLRTAASTAGAEHVRPGERVRAYFIYDGGALATRVDLLGR